MAQTGYTPISLYYTSTASAVPTSGNLVNGELALNINTADGKLFYKDSAGVVQVLATKGSATVGGANTQIQYNNSGALAGSSNFVFDGTQVGIGTSSPTRTLDVYLAAGASITARSTTAESQVHVQNSTSDVYLFNSNASNSVGIYDGTATTSLMTYNRASNFWTFFTSGTERLRITSAGAVGIGTNSPSTQLDVVGAGGGASQLTISDGANQGSIVLSKSSTKYAIAGGSDYGGLFFYSNSTTARMNIDNAGNVGIGTASQAGRLDVVGVAGAPTYIFSRNTNTTSGDSAQFQAINGTVQLQMYAYSSSGLGAIGTASNHPLIINTNGAEIIRVTTAGNVGVNQNTPNYKLTVGGDLYSTTSGVAGNNPVLNGQNANTLLKAGAFVGFNWTNMPATYDGSAWALVEVFTNGSDQHWQRYTSAPYVTPKIYIRGSSNGGSTWTSWTQVL